MEKPRHKCRPVHPECSALSSKYSSCTCPAMWGGEVSLDTLRNVYDRLDMRTKHGRLIDRGRGHGPDRDDYSVWGYLDSLQYSLTTSDGHSTTVDLSTELEIAGFWKESEFLATVDMPTEYVEMPTKITLDKQD